MTATGSTPQVVVIGGGFAGLFAARRLAAGPVSVTVIDDTGVHLFQPLLYQCATGLLSEGQITAPLRRLFRRHRNVVTLLADVSGVDVTARTVTAVRPDGSELSVGYDYLIVAAGVRQSYFGHEEYAPHAPGMKSIDDALTIRRRIIDAFEMAETLPAPELRRPWLTFALVGAGPTGVELAGQLRELAGHTLREQFRSIDPAEARVLLFDGGDAPLASFGPKLAASAARTLRALGVELHLRTRVTHVDGEGLEVRASGGEPHRVEARTVLWTAGVAAVPLADAIARATGAAQDRSGRLLVEPDLRLPGHPNIFVAGDMMSLDDLPGVAEAAMQAGLHAAGQVLRAVRSEPGSQPFVYRDLGSAAYISRGHAVVKAGPLSVSGRLGWLLWGVIHIAFLTGFRNRAGAVLSWLGTLAMGSRRELVSLRRDLATGREAFRGGGSPRRPGA
ncbi:MAG: NAD(P)/FAD-dependent oxidoreductase [Actinomycetota bacterium]|nr:NAD(P)/FAD-dependent oxidoreductase [Actinomycetota bacterium]